MIITFSFLVIYVNYRFVIKIIDELREFNEEERWRKMFVDDDGFENLRIWDYYIEGAIAGWGAWLGK